MELGNESNKGLIYFKNNYYCVFIKEYFFRTGFTLNGGNIVNNNY